MILRLSTSAVISENRIISTTWIRLKRAVLNMARQKTSLRQVWMSK